MLLTGTRTDKQTDPWQGLTTRKTIGTTENPTANKFSLYNIQI